MCPLSMKESSDKSYIPSLTGCKMSRKPLKPGKIQVKLIFPCCSARNGSFFLKWKQQTLISCSVPKNRLYKNQHFCKSTVVQ